jgi:hypothetical protein
MEELILNSEKDKNVFQINKSIFISPVNEFFKRKKK